MLPYMLVAYSLWASPLQSAINETQIDIQGSLVRDMALDGADSLILLSQGQDRSGEHAYLTRINPGNQSASQIASFDSSPYNLLVTSASLYVSSMDGIVRAYDRRSGSPVGKWQAASYAWTTNCFQDTAHKEIYAVSGNGTAKVISEIGGHARSTHFPVFNGIAFQFDRNEFVIGKKGSIRLYDVSTLKPKRLISSLADADFADSFELSPNGRYLMATITSTDGPNGSGRIFLRELRVYDTNSWKLVVRIPPLENPFVKYGCAFSQDSSQLGCAGDGVVRFYRLADGSESRRVPVPSLKPICFLAGLANRTWILLDSGFSEGRIRTSYRYLPAD